MKSSYPIVEVEWEDSSSCSPWVDPANHLDDATWTGAHCTSVGYCIREDDTRILLAHSTCENGEVASVWRIPASAVRSKRVLQEATAA